MERETVLKDINYVEIIQGRCKYSCNEYSSCTDIKQEGKHVSWKVKLQKQTLVPGYLIHTTWKVLEEPNQ